MQQGWSAHLLTLTVRHERAHDPAAVLEVLRRAWERTTSGAAWRRVRERGGVEYARGYDMTWSPAHGWHPHLHLSLYLAPEHGDGAEVARWFLARWIDSLHRLGWEAVADAQDAQRCDDPERAARYAVTPAAVYEALAMAMKRSRGQGSGATPFEILARAVDGAPSPFPFRVGQARARELWQEYVRATKGRRQVNTSRGITLSDDEDLVQPEDGDEVDELALLGPQSLRELDRRRLTALLLDEAEAGAGDELSARYRVRHVLEELEADDWRIRLFESLDPGPPNRPDRLDLAIPW